MRSAKAAYNMLSVSAMQAEDGINIFKSPDMTLMVGDGDYLKLNRRRETNLDELNGQEEADAVYDNGGTSELSLNFTKLQPHQLAFLLAYGLGACNTIAAGTGYEHTITPVNGEFEAARALPTFTAVQRLGKTINHRRMASMAIDSVSLSLPLDGWVSATGQAVGTGKYEDSTTEEVIVAAGNATSITLSGAVLGTTAAERLDAVQTVRASIDGAWVHAAINAVSDDAAGAVITIEPVSVTTDDVEYRVLYNPPNPAWADYSGRVTETPLKVSQACLKLGGTWDGSAFQGGWEIKEDFRGFEYSLTNTVSPLFTLCAGGDFAGRLNRDNRNQTIKLDRELKDMLLQQYAGSLEYFGLHLIAEGAEFAAGHKYTVELIFPRLAILDAPISTGDKVLAEAGDLQVLADATHGSVIAKIKNQVTGYAAL